MQTTKDCQIQLAGEQVPLLHQDQLRRGVYLAGPTSQHVWEIVEVKQTIVVLQKLPKQVPCLEHAFVSKGQGEECVCGLRNQPIAGDMGLLPKKPGLARIYLIIPNAIPQMPEEFTLYAYLTECKEIKIVRSIRGREVRGTAIAKCNWSQSLPIIPILYKVWEVPKALRDLSTTH